MSYHFCILHGRLGRCVPTNLVNKLMKLICAAAQVGDLMNELLHGLNEVPFLGFLQMFHSYHFFARKLALPRRIIAAWERNGEDESIYERKQELLELLGRVRVGFSPLFEAKMSIVSPNPPIVVVSGKGPRDRLAAEK
jgi:hypothetical protein